MSLMLDSLKLQTPALQQKMLLFSHLIGKGNATISLLLLCLINNRRVFNLEFVLKPFLSKLNKIKHNQKVVSYHI